MKLKQKVITGKKNSLFFTRDKVYIKQSKRASTNLSSSNQAETLTSKKESLASMKIAHTNINGIRNKVDHINAGLSDYCNYLYI